MRHSTKYIFEHYRFQKFCVRNWKSDSNENALKRPWNIIIMHWNNFTGSVLCYGCIIWQYVHYVCVEKPLPCIVWSMCSRVVIESVSVCMEAPTKGPCALIWPFTVCFVWFLLWLLEKSHPSYCQYDIHDHAPATSAEVFLPPRGKQPSLLGRGWSQNVQKR